MMVASESKLCFLYQYLLSDYHRQIIPVRTLEPISLKGPLLSLSFSANPEIDFYIPYIQQEELPKRLIILSACMLH